jgi:hypothetical protein
MLCADGCEFSEPHTRGGPHQSKVSRATFIVFFCSSCRLVPIDDLFLHCSHSERVIHLPQCHGGGWVVGGRPCQTTFTFVQPTRIDYNNKSPFAKTILKVPIKKREISMVDRFKLPFGASIFVSDQQGIDLACLKIHCEVTSRLGAVTGGETKNWHLPAR